MPVRIYALAKELKLDSKDLVDICTKAGVTGKGSALASLTDEEETKLRAHLANLSKPAAPPPAAPVMEPVPSAPMPKPIPILSSTPPPQTEKPAPVQPAKPQVSTPAPLAASVAQVSGNTPFRREDYIGPSGGASSRPPVLDVRSKSSKPKDGTKRPAEGPKPSRSTMKLAPMPPTPHKEEAPRPQEPAPQKPDIKLPPDAIRAASAGKTPLSRHLRETEKRRRGPETPGKPPRPGEVPVAPRADDASRSPGRGDRRPATAPKELSAEERASQIGRAQRQEKRRKDVVTRREDEDEESSRRSRLRRSKQSMISTVSRKGRLVVELPCTVRSFSEGVGVPAAKVLGKLMGLNIMCKVNDSLSNETAELLATEMGLEVEFKRPVNLEDQLGVIASEEADTAESLVTRPPVVTFLGHVDHGKTSLLDRIIGTKLVSGESGGITQHIRAYQVDHNGHAIAFVDTPGHEAFTEIRARGANVTDVAVLVVAADDGVMPQTEEAISHARAAEVPIVVALNKIDLPNIDENRVLQQLAAQNLLAAEWGGDIEVVRCSAMTGKGIDDLLETLLTIAELHDYKANPDKAAFGTCLEAELHEGRGVIAKFLVQRGTLHPGDVVVCGSTYGKVKALQDTLNPRKRHQAAGPSMPVNVTGLDTPPGAGEHFYVLNDIAQAREIATKRADQSRQQTLFGPKRHMTLESLYESKAQSLNVILRCDVRGSIEAIQKELTKLEHPEVQVRILQAMVGGITEADVYLADASDAIIIGFNVVPDERARELAEAKGVQIRRYEVIYKVTDELKAALEGMLKPIQKEVELGRALVQRTFAISRLGVIAGCRVLAGTIERSGRARVARENRIIGDYPIDSLRRIKDDVKEVREGLECGIKLSGFNDLKEGDVLHVYRTEQVARSLNS